jgi:hypothetical protein
LVPAAFLVPVLSAGLAVGDFLAAAVGDGEGDTWLAALDAGTCTDTAGAAGAASGSAAAAAGAGPADFGSAAPAGAGSCAGSGSAAAEA